jgi:calcineurin-like phosphoesterase family protein
MVEYCGRPDNHTELIGNNLLNFGFTKQHMLIHLGDVCIGHDDEAHEKYIKPLPCKKILVTGNHDKKSNTWYLNHGWDFVCHEFRDKYYGKKIVFSHKPVVWDGEYDLNAHGHFHNTDHRSQEPELYAIRNRYQKLFAIEYTNYKPVALEDFIKYNEIIL